MELNIAATLKEFRRDNELEQGDLARLLDTTQQTISNWESGTVPRAGALRRINHLLANYDACKRALASLHDIQVFVAASTEEAAQILAEAEDASPEELRGDYA